MAVERRPPAAPAAAERTVPGARADPLRGVVVDAQEVGGRRDHVEVAVAIQSSGPQRRSYSPSMSSGYSPAQDRVEEPAVHVAVHPHAAASRPRRPDLPAAASAQGSARWRRGGRPRRAQRLHPEPVREQHVVGHAQGDRPVRRPGALRPSAWPWKATTQGSLCVIHSDTTSPNCSATNAAYSAKRSAVSRAAQPPRSWSACGRSQW